MKLTDLYQGEPNSIWFKGISIELEGLKAIQLIDIKHYNLTLHLSTISFQSFTITCTGVFTLETNKIGCPNYLASNNICLLIFHTDYPWKIRSTKISSTFLDNFMQVSCLKKECRNNMIYLHTIQIFQDISEFITQSFFLLI